jgi:UDP-glucose 4-epimerase
VKSNPNRILVTGGAGFIGSHLVERLAELGYEVRVFDNFSKGRKENLAEVMNEVELIHGDVRDHEAVDRAVKDVDTIVHLAALIDVQESLGKTLLYHEVNSTGTLNLLNSAGRGVEKFIFTSSCAVYGNPIKLPVNEDHRLNPLSPYAASKLSAESYCRAYSESYGLKTTIFRLFNVYGPRQGANQYSGVIKEFTKRVIRNQPPIIFGDGEQTRDFIFVENVVDFIVEAIKSGADGTFNLGTGSSVSIERLAEILLKVMNRGHLRPIHTEPKLGEIKHSRAEISKAIEAFSIKPDVTLEEGLRKTLDADYSDIYNKCNGVLARKF